MSEKEIFDLLHRYASGNYAPEDAVKIRQLMADSRYHAVILDFMDAFWEKLEDRAENSPPVSRDQKDLIFQRIAGKMEPTIAPVPKSRNIVRIWTLAGAAAALVLFISVLLSRKAADSPVVQRDVPIAAVTDIAAPAATYAYLQTDNGLKLGLKELGTLPGSPALITENGSVMVRYISQQNNVPRQSQWHELVNPRGSKKINLTLSDGTLVSLNAGSTIRYPAGFTGAIRVVELKGEAYFEVAKDKKHPFTVHTGSGDVEVLGTHFNVNTSRFDSVMQVTLLEGSVKVSHNGRSDVLHPGEQAVVGDVIDVSRAVESKQVLAWTNEEFNFTGMDLREILKEIERWYDVDITIAQNVPEMRLSGILSRNLSVRQVLDIVSLSSGIQFTINNKIIMVTAGE
ncbi:FecR family protein [Flavihumibacter petaseus]|uniref:Putative anti-sigma factor n=1 Tax=Flavihumibacter petaseus NBRC 106054 TaxID=1220578 RepID=A0A0E9N106_9BACT|nr:FecR domain-containing protein [Flavihumibacter petaseus]GAO43524.1 putative anti-sigma factor [Flavihumibacter petaseus NBRC 106054]